MAKFRKKPVVIEAVLWTGRNVEEVNAFINEGQDEETLPGRPIVIETLEGDVTAQVGDWIIKGVAGEFYPCKPNIFEQTYEQRNDA